LLKCFDYRWNCGDNEAHLNLARDLIFAKKGKEKEFADRISKLVDSVQRKMRRPVRRIVISDSEEEDTTPSQEVETFDDDDEDSPAVLLSESAECAMCDGLAQV
jgi:hypothetical protein